MKMRSKFKAAIILAAATVSLAQVFNMTRNRQQKPEAGFVDPAAPHVTIEPPPGWTEDAFARQGFVRAPEDMLAKGDVIVVPLRPSPVLDAMINHPSTGNSESACLGEGVGQMMSYLQTDKGMASFDASVLVIKNLRPVQIESLPLPVKKTFMEVSVGGAQASYDDLQEALFKLYSNTPEDINFMYWDAQRQQELSEVLARDPVLADARRNWRRMDKGQKLVAMQRTSDLVIQVYGAAAGFVYAPVTVEFMQDKNRNLSGSYSRATRIISMNEKAPQIPENFEQTMGSVVHESIHAFHDQAEVNILRGNLTPQSPAYDYMSFIMQSFRLYIKDDSNINYYLSNPTERHAREVSYLGAYAGAGDRHRLREASDRYSEAVRKKDEHDARRAAAVSQAQKSGGLCTPFKLK